MTNTDGSNNLKGAYDQLCNSYRAIDDFRAKLLGFLPLVTGGGLILLAGQATDVKDFFGPAGLFGIAVTTGLLAYELFGIRKCHQLLEAGKALEEEMDLPAGQFIDRPTICLGLSTSRSPPRPSTPPCWPRGPTLHCSSVTVTGARSSAPLSSSQGSWESCCTTNLCVTSRSRDGCSASRAS
jgi:hypothetical protein